MGDPGPNSPPSNNHHQAQQQPNCDIVSVLEDFLGIFTNVLQEASFLMDYNTKFPIVNDFEIFEQMGGCSIDPTRKHYILNALCCDTKQESAFNALSERSVVLLIYAILSTYIQKTARLVDKSGGSNTPRGAWDLLRRGQGPLWGGPTPEGPRPLLRY